MTKHSKNSEISSSPSQSNEMIELYEKAEAIQQEGNPSNAMSITKKALRIALVVKNREYQYLCHYNIARCQLSLGNFDNAHKSMAEALNIAKQHLAQNKEKLSLATNATGIIYYSQNNMEFALDYFMKALQFGVEKNKLKIYNNLGNIYFFSGNHEKAIEYYDLSLAGAKEKKDHYMTATLLLNATAPLFYYNDFEKAKKNTLHALAIINEYAASDQRFALLNIYVLLNFGKIHIHEDNFEKATKVISEAMEAAKVVSLYECYCRGLYFKASIHLSNDTEAKALPFVHKALAYADQHQLYKEKSEMLERIVEFYEQQEEYGKAYPFLKQLHNYEKEEANLSRKQNFSRIIATRKQKIESLESQNNDIKDQNLLLEQFAHIISHDLKEPIRNIVSFSSLLNKRYYELLDDAGREFLKYIIKGATTMNLNLTRLLDFTTLKIVVDEEIQKVQFSHVVEELLDYYKGAINPFEINITYPNRHFHMVYSHAYALLDEIVSNAIKFRKRGMNCYIEINSEIEAGNLHLSIKDYGIGIEPEFKEQIFRIFNRLNKKEYDGSGVGLAICERIIQLYRGEIWIESAPDVYTTIHITLPITKD